MMACSVLMSAGAWWCCLSVVALLVVGDLPAEVVTVRVVDEMERPVAGATIKVAVPRAKSPGTGWGLGSSSVREYSAGDSGELDVQIRFNSQRFVGIRAEKQGYYDGSVGIRPDALQKDLRIVLRPIGDPVLMAQKIERLEIDPENQGKWLKYGPLTGEWLNGDTDDNGAVHFLVRLDEMEKIRYVNSRYGDVLVGKVKITLSVPHEDCGFLVLDELPYPDSDFKWPREAPVGGYLSSVSFMKEQKSPEEARLMVGLKNGDDPLGKAIIFRVRSRDGDGFHYGKIIPRKSLQIPLSDYQPPVPGSLTIGYYLNPNVNDRALESEAGVSLLGSDVLIDGGP